LPARERLAVAADVLAGAADRDQHAPRRGPILQLPAHVRRYARELARLQRVRLALDDERERAVEHEVDLLLLAVPVDPAALPRLERQLVETERLDAECPPEREEALVGVAIDARA
jgi:hypothetical protein